MHKFTPQKSGEIFLKKLKSTFVNDHKKTGNFFHGMLSENIKKY